MIMVIIVMQAGHDADETSRTWSREPPLDRGIRISEARRAD